MKTCHTCKETKPVGEFHLRGDRKGYRPNCKECFRKAARLRNNSDKEKKRLAAVKEVEAIARNPHGFIAAAVIEKAIKDYREEKSTRGEVLAFFCGDWFAELCEMAGCDAEYMRRMIL